MVQLLFLFLCGLITENFRAAICWGLLLTGCEDSSSDGIAIIQYKVQDADAIGSDFDRLSGFIRTAASHGAQLVVAPETPLHRYTPYSQNGVTMTDFAAEYASLVAKFSSLAAELDITLIVGLREPAGGGKVYNTAVCLGPDGRLIGVHRKKQPSLGEIDFTVSGGSYTLLSTPIGRIGLAVCKDIWDPAVLAAYAPGSIDLMVVIAADNDGRVFNNFGPLCARVGCQGVLANQAFGSGNSALAGPDGSVEYLGGGEDIFYTDLP